MSKTQQLRRAIIAVTVSLTLAGCEAPRQGVSDTDTFLRNAFDAYGVIDVVPTQNARRTPDEEQLDTTESDRQVSTRSIPVS